MNRRNNNFLVLCFCINARWLGFLPGFLYWMSPFWRRHNVKSPHWNYVHVVVKSTPNVYIQIFYNIISELIRRIYACNLEWIPTRPSYLNKFFVLVAKGRPRRAQCCPLWVKYCTRPGLQVGTKSTEGELATNRLCGQKWCKGRSLPAWFPVPCPFVQRESCVDPLLQGTSITYLHVPGRTCRVSRQISRSCHLLASCTSRPPTEFKRSM